MPHVTHPLDGLRVLDFSRVVAGPFATRMLSDLGADVLKVEPPEGDVTRSWGTRIAGLSGFFVQQNAGKRNISVDLKAEGARELLLELGAKADIVVENFRPGVMARFGLSYDDFKMVNPSVIMLSISGFGQESSWSDRAAYAPIIHAESGLLGRQARFDQNLPSDPMLSIADTNASLHGLVGLLSALWMRERTGTGQHIDMAMLNSMTVTDDYSHHALDASETARLGGQVRPTGYGAILVTGELRSQWWQLNRAGKVEDGLGPDASLDDKIEARTRVIADWFASFDDRDALTAELDDANMAWADVREPEDVFATDIAAERELSTDVDDRAGGTRRVVQSPYRFSDAEAGVRSGASFRGEHNRVALAEWIGSTESEVDALTTAGVLLSEDRADAETGDP